LRVKVDKKGEKVKRHEGLKEKRLKDKKKECISRIPLIRKSIARAQSIAPLQIIVIFLQMLK